MGANKFPLETLPEPLQAIIINKNQVEGWDVNSLSVALVSAMASTIGSNVTLVDRWESKPILWVAIIGENGTMKTPIINFSYQYLIKKDKESMLEYSAELEEFNEDKTLPKPKEKNYIILTHTTESIIKKHKGNPKGLALLQDELSGWLNGFNKYTKGGNDRDLALQMWNGNPMKTSLKNSDTEYIANPCVNVIGGIQPSKLKLISNKESREEGFLQRFLLVRQYPTMHLESEEEVSQDLIDSMLILFDKVFNYPVTQLKLSKEAKKVYLKWQHHWEPLTYQDELKRGIQRKLVTYLFRLCVVFDVMDQVATDVKREEVTPDTMEKVIKVIDFHRSEIIDSFNESFKADPLSFETPHFREIYNSLNGRDYSATELLEIFRPVYESNTSMYKRLKNIDLFITDGKGNYKRAIQDVK